MIIASVNLIAIIFFVCMADEFIDPVTNFAGLCVLSELDDWIGDLINKCKPSGAETLSSEERNLQMTMTITPNMKKNLNIMRIISKDSTTEFH